MRVVAVLLTHLNGPSQRQVWRAQSLGDGAECTKGARGRPSGPGISLDRLADDGVQRC